VMEFFRDPDSELTRSGAPALRNDVLAAPICRPGL
jgi:hypothetical protein